MSNGNGMQIEWNKFLINYHMAEVIAYIVIKMLVANTSIAQLNDGKKDKD